MNYNNRNISDYTKAVTKWKTALQIEITNILRIFTNNLSNEMTHWKMV